MENCWAKSDSTSSVELAPLALLARLAALVPPPRRQTFEIDTVCPRCKTPLCLIALIATEDTIKKILSAVGLPTEPPRLWPPRPPPSLSGGEGGDCSKSAQKAASIRLWAYRLTGGGVIILTMSDAPTVPLAYVHGYSTDEAARLSDQADTLAELIHLDTHYPAGGRFLEAGCGVGAQTVHLLRHSPEAHFTLVDCNVDSLAAARAAIGSTSADISRVTFSHADLFAQAHGGGDANIGRRLYPC